MNEWKNEWIMLVLYAHVQVGRKINAHSVSVGNPEGKKPLGRPRCRKQDHIKNRCHRTNRMWWYGLDTSGSDQGPLAGSCEPCKEPSGSIQCEALTS